MINLNDINTNNETQLGNLTSASIANCLDASNCFGLKYQSPNYYSYATSEFDGAETTSTLCNLTACDAIACKIKICLYTYFY